MDKTIFYTVLDIDNAEEFKYYENMAALIENDEYIESNLIKELMRDVDKESLAELTDSYMEELLKIIPDNETDLYITVEGIKRVLAGMIGEAMTQDEVAILADELVKFRKWFVHDLLAFNMKTGEEVCVRDAVYDIAAAGYLGKTASYDFRLACDYELDGYDVRISDMLGDEYADDETEDYDN